MNSPVFSLSPFYAAADKTLGHAAHRVLTLLCGFADPEGLCFPSRKMLSYLTGIENSNLSKYINVLCRKGYLEKVNASGNRYKIIGFKDKQWPMRWLNVVIITTMKINNMVIVTTDMVIITTKKLNVVIITTKMVIITTKTAIPW